jgi:hypothetical protein
MEVPLPLYKIVECLVSYCILKGVFDTYNWPEGGTFQPYKHKENRVLWSHIAYYNAYLIHIIHQMEVPLPLISAKKVGLFGLTSVLVDVTIEIERNLASDATVSFTCMILVCCMHVWGCKIRTCFPLLLKLSDSERATRRWAYVHVTCLLYACARL